LIASVLSVEAAIAYKFFAYERWTFRDRPRRGPLAWRFVQLNTASGLGAVVTIGTVNVLTPVLGLSPYVSTVAGVLAAFMLNWVFSSHFIWRKHDTEQAVP
jgi:putative flippase GtrA